MNNIIIIFSLIIFLFYFSIFLNHLNEKKYLKLKYKALPYHKERSFFQALEKTAIEHDYSGFLFRTRFLFRRIINHFLQIFSKILPYSGLRILLHRLRGVTIGNKVHIGPSVTIDDVYPDYVRIDDGVSVAGQNFILTHNKPLAYHRSVSKAFLSPVHLKKDSWIAIGAIILPGITVGEGSIVGAGAVVTADVPDNVFVGGVPAKTIKRLNKVSQTGRKDLFDKENRI